MEFFVIKNNDGKYFYNHKNFLDSPEFGEFNIAAMTLFETVNHASTCKNNLESVFDMDVSIQKLTVSLSEL